MDVNANDVAHESANASARQLSIHYTSNNNIGLNRDRSSRSRANQIMKKGGHNSMTSSKDDVLFQALGHAYKYSQRHDVFN